MEQRMEMLADRHTLPSRYWEPQPDEEDLERMRKEYEERHRDEPQDDEELPFK